MKQGIHYILLAVCLLLGLLYSCVDDETVPEKNVTNAKIPVLSDISSVVKTASTITIEGEVLEYNGYPVTERGICWGTGRQPDISKDSYKSQTGEGDLIKLTADDLKGATLYYFRLFATNQAGTAYSKLDSTITDDGLGRVETIIVAEHTRATTAKVGGYISARGEGAILEYGVYYYEKLKGVASKDSVISTMNIAEKDTFLCDLPQLLPSTVYVIQAYVKNRFGIFMGSTKELTTGSGKPVLNDDITITPKSNQATVNAAVLGIGDAPLISRGFYWNKTGSLTIFEDSLSVVFSGDGIGTMSAVIQPLIPTQVYYVFAYATNEYGTTYSPSKQFTTSSDKPTVTTLGAPVIGDSTVILEGRVMDVGASNVERVGVCYSTSQTPSITDPKVEILLSPTLPEERVPYTFSTGAITGLKGATTYYYRAYATNNQGVSYGSVSSFQTPLIFTQETESFTGGTRVEGSSAYFVIGQIGYLLGGDIGPSYINNLWIYDPVLIPDRWRERNAYTAGNLKWMSPAVIDTRVYVLGGLGAGSVEKDDFYVYNPVDNSWFQRPTGPGPGYLRAGFSLNNEIVYVGGMKDTAKNEVWAYDVLANSWTQKTDFPTKQYGGIAVTIENNVYAGLGKNTAGVGNTQLWKSNGALTTWIPESTGSILNGNIIVYTVLQGKIYVVDKTSSNSYTIFEYDPVTMVWTRKSDLPDYRWDIQFMYAIRNRIYIGFADSNKVVSYNPLWDN